MDGVFKRLRLGFLFIVAAASVLLFSDLGQRRGGRRVPRIAIFQCASAAVPDDGVQGIKDALARVGYAHDKNISLREFNAENDMPTANAIARQPI